MLSKVSIEDLSYDLRLCFKDGTYIYNWPRKYWLRHKDEKDLTKGYQLNDYWGEVKRVREAKNGLDEDNARCLAILGRELSDEEVGNILGDGKLLLSPPEGYICTVIACLNKVGITYVEEDDLLLYDCEEDYKIIDDSEGLKIGYFPEENKQ